MALTTVLAQSAPVATTLTDIYTVPDDFRDSLYVVVTNTTTVPVAYRIAFAPAAAPDTRAHYVVYDDTVSTKPQATRKVALPGGTVVRVYAATADLNFTVNGLEKS